VYLELLEIVRSLYNKYETKVFILNLLMSDIYGLSRQQATILYFDSLNFFYADNKIKQSAWENIYADHLDNLAYYALEKDDLETARRCFAEAAKLRGAGRDEITQVPEEMKVRPIVIYSMDPEKLGLPRANRKLLGKFIDDLPEITEKERVRFKQDAGIIDVNLFEDAHPQTKD